MSIEDEIHQLVRGLDGVATVYAADPVWRTAVKALGSWLGPGGEVPAFVVCTEESADPLFIEADADDGASPAGAVSRSLGGATAPAVMTVRVRIGTDGSQPAPFLARTVAAAIRSLVSAQHPEVAVKAVVEVSAIGV